MREIVKDVYIIEGIGNANVFLLGKKEGFSVIDTGIFKRTDELIGQITEQCFDPANLQMILLTHCHCDHIGGVTELIKVSGAQVAAHGEDIPYILQETVIQGAYHGMMLEEQKVMRQFHCNITNVDRKLKNGDILDILNGLRVIEVPGHTPGSIALYEEARKIMFFGDVVRNNRKIGLTAGVPEKFNFDTEYCAARVRHERRKSAVRAGFQCGSGGKSVQSERQIVRYRSLTPAENVGTLNNAFTHTEDSATLRSDMSAV